MAVAFGGAHTALLADPVMPGQALYLGEVPIEARLRGQALVLPTAASRCTNCHEAAAREADLKAGIGAPRLNKATLTEPTSRRGGPVSSYDEAAFCKLLKTGVDPAYVLVRKTMPQFQTTDEQCQQLWAYLSQREPAAEVAP